MIPDIVLKNGENQLKKLKEIITADVSESTEASCYLLPCPFCGGKAEFFTTSSDNGEGFDIGCYTDSCIMRSGSDVQYNTKQSAAKEWNTRIFAVSNHKERVIV